MTPPRIEQSTKEERLAFVLNQWKCLSNCEICGKCSMLRGRNEEMLYADYIDGKRSYMDIIKLQSVITRIQIHIFLYSNLSQAIIKKISRYIFVKKYILCGSFIMSIKVESPQHFSGRVINLKNSENICHPSFLELNSQFISVLKNDRCLNHLSFYLSSIMPLKSTL